MEDYWVDAVERRDDSLFGTGQWHSTDECLSWQAPIKPFELAEEDLARTALDYVMFQRGIDVKATQERLGLLSTYSAKMMETSDVVRWEVEK